MTITNYPCAKPSAILLLLSTIGLTSLSVGVSARSISPLPEKYITSSFFKQHIDNTYYFYVTGSTSGSIYGDGVYTSDSSLAKAAVHAGLLAVGQKGVIKVKTLPGLSNYSSSTQNGITSNAYGSWDGSIMLEADDGGDNGIVPAPSSLYDFQDLPGEVYLFSVTTDKANPVYGSNVYTYDTKIEAAAVHAGVLTDGTEGTVRVLMGAKQSIFLSSYDAQRTFKSKAYSSASASYSISDVNANTPLIAYPGSPANPIELDGNDGLFNYKDFTGGSFYFAVTGNTTGSVYGSDIYTYDSYVAAAAVHAGVVAANATALVKATILPSQGNFVGSTKNGVTSKSYSSNYSCYKFESPDGSLGAIPVINSALAVTYVPGKSLDYQISATGSPKTYTANGLPKGLSINKNTGFISGFPQLTGRFAIELQASNSSGASAKTLILTVPGEVSTADCLFSYAETNFPQLFSGGDRITKPFQGYIYRLYTNTNTYLGFYQGERIDILRANVSSDIINVGTISQYKPIAGCK